MQRRSQCPATYTIKVQVTDSGGLTAVDTATVNVTYNFAGFFQPVDNLPTLNSVKCGPRDSGEIQPWRRPRAEHLCGRLSQVGANHMQLKRVS